MNLGPRFGIGVTSSHLGEPLLSLLLALSTNKEWEGGTSGAVDVVEATACHAFVLVLRPTRIVEDDFK